MRFSVIWLVPLVVACGVADKPGGDGGGDTHTSAESIEDTDTESEGDSDPDEPGNCTAQGGVCNSGDQYQCNHGEGLQGECGTYPGPASCCLEPVPCGPTDEGLCMREHGGCATLSDVGDACLTDYICCEQ
jgi:hypothetical protein